MLVGFERIDGRWPVPHDRAGAAAVHRRAAGGLRYGCAQQQIRREVSNNKLNSTILYYLLRIVEFGFRGLLQILDCAGVSAPWMHNKWNIVALSFLGVSLFG